MDLYHKFAEILDHKNVLIDEPMSKHTTFKIGGKADYFVTPNNHKALWQIITLCKENYIPYYIIGNGSNLLVGDGGFTGVIIQISSNLSKIDVTDNYVKAEAGAMLSKITSIALEKELKGLEFAAGIPGTFGGAVMMNAGAYGGEMKDVIESVRVLDEHGQLKTLTNEELELGYRTSILTRKPYVVIDGILKLENGNREEILGLMKDLADRRISKQPLEYPSAGSTFKRPEGYFAGKLIADAGLKGFQIGGAQVSNKHAGFVINVGDATAKDVITLMEEVKGIVFEKYGVELKAEVKQIGNFR